ncbi:uncharacterized protein [Macaca nemestrina]|uniref:uncharacterized protein n=1 Tax=Macaca nemestrina TaxID=9545 RepID=UPI0039B85400
MTLALPPFDSCSQSFQLILYNTRTEPLLLHPNTLPSFSGSHCPTAGVANLQCPGYPAPPLQYSRCPLPAARRPLPAAHTEQSPRVQEPEQRRSETGWFRGLWRSTGKRRPGHTAPRTQQPKPSGPSSSSGSRHPRKPPLPGASISRTRHRWELPQPGAATAGSLHLLEPPPLGAATSGAAAAQGPAGPPHTPQRRLRGCPRPGGAEGAHAAGGTAGMCWLFLRLRGRGAGRRSGRESWSRRESSGQACWVPALALAQRPWDPRSVAVEGAGSDPGRSCRSSSLSTPTRAEPPEACSVLHHHCDGIRFCDCRCAPSACPRAHAGPLSGALHRPRGLLWD